MKAEKFIFDEKIRKNISRSLRNEFFSLLNWLQALIKFTYILNVPDQKNSIFFSKLVTIGRKIVESRVYKKTKADNIRFKEKLFVLP